MGNQQLKCAYSYYSPKCRPNTDGPCPLLTHVYHNGE